MKKNNEIGEIYDSIRSINVSYFLLSIDSFLNFASLMDKTLLFPGASPQSANMSGFQEKYENSFGDISREASDILIRSRASRTRITNYRFHANGNPPGKNKTNGSGAAYFYKIKRHQMDLLFDISDSVAIMESMVERARDMQTIVRANKRTIRASSKMMDIMKERITRRPSTLLQIQGEEQKDNRLRLTFNGIDEFEALGSRESGHKGNNGERFSFYHGLMGETYRRVKGMGEDVKNDVKELQYGCKFLRRLATKGYTPRIKKKLNKLVENNGHRRRKFQEDVEKSREKFLSPNPEI